MLKRGAEKQKPLKIKGNIYILWNMAIILPQYFLRANFSTSPEYKNHT